MFHSMNLNLTPLLAKTQGIKHIAVETCGEKERELEDLRRVIEGLDVDGVVSGAIASRYQKDRVDALCQDTDLVHLAPLWGRHEGDLLDEVVEAGMVVVVSAVAAMGLGESWLGRVLDGGAIKQLKVLSKRYGFNVSGEGGEMETLVLDAPWFENRLRIVRAESTWDGMRGSYLVKEAELEPRV